MKHRTHEEMRGEFITTPQDEAELADVRQQHGLTQTDVAERLHISQTAVSKIERGELARSELSTIRKYVEAIGGKVEIIADFGDERLVLGQPRPPRARATMRGPRSATFEVAAVAHE